MSNEGRFAIGVDPGVTETGVVLSQEDARGDLIPVAHATMSCPPGESQVARVTALAGNVVNLILCWVEEYKIEAVDIAIELPIFNGNAQSLILQIRLLQEIESGIFHIVAGELMECWVTEVNPITSKSLAGCARGEKPVSVSPFADYKARKATKEALADAWAHSLATWGIAKKATRLAMHDMTSALVVVNDSKPETVGQHPWVGYDSYNLREAP